jgi:type VI protein secretion system component VasK
MRAAISGLITACTIYAAMVQHWKATERAAWRESAERVCEENKVTWEGEFATIEQCVQSWMALVKQEFGL